MSEATRGDWLTVNGAAERLGVGRSAIYGLVSSGKLACYRMVSHAGRLKFKASDLDSYAESCRVGPKVKAAAAPKPPRYVPKYDHGY